MTQAVASTGTVTTTAASNVFTANANAVHAVIRSVRVSASSSGTLKFVQADGSGDLYDLGALAAGAELTWGNGLVIEGGFCCIAGGTSITAHVVYDIIYANIAI
jgi:hypothetical protein